MLVVDATVPAVRCAPDHLERVLLNLLANALRHTPGDGSVAVVVARDGDGDGGAGLGLASAKGLVGAQVGRIWAEARSGGGARISLVLPAASG